MQTPFSIKNHAYNHFLETVIVCSFASLPEEDRIGIMNLWEKDVKEDLLKHDIHDGAPEWDQFNYVKRLVLQLHSNLKKDENQ